MNLITYKNPKSPVAEVYRTLRTNLKFTSFDKDIQTIVFTSTGPNEGKSTVVANLAITLAQSGSKVLILEGDLRNPTVHKNFMLPNLAGVTNILTENAPYQGYLSNSAIENLDIITCGPKPPNPAELLGSRRMRELLEVLKRDYEYILIDAPPVVVVTDAALLASVCDGTILVVGAGEAVVDGAVKAKELLQNVKANILGVVLNKVKLSGSKGYYGYYSYYYDDSDKVKKKRKGKKLSWFKRRTTHV